MNQKEMSLSTASRQRFKMIILNQNLEFLSDENLQKKSF